MAKNVLKKIATVRTHKRRVPISTKNPSGTTIVDQHIRRIPGTSLSKNEIRKIYTSYDRKHIVYPTKNKLSAYKNADLYDDLIAVWTDYFNKKFRINPPLDPNLIKALIGSESGFDPNPSGNRIALGVAQITKSTLKILQDPHGEAKDFIFPEVSQKDLKEPDISIPLAVRWLFRKNATAASKLGRSPSHDEIILEYKGMLKSKTDLKKKALQNFKEKYDKLKK